ncbi:MAG: sugar phosphate isomerase/epimerase [Actinomycetota bacterium]|nr:sugar phosphate isomerase/epimerase [Actinomycetota bacterium]
MSAGEAPRFGVSEFSTWPWSFEQDVAAYAALGVEVMEVCEAKLDPERAEAQLRTISEAGLVVASMQPRLHSIFPDAPRPLPSEPADRTARLRTSIELAGRSIPGATLVTITGAARAGNFREAYTVAISQYRVLADLAAIHGVRLALEPLNPILMNVDTFVSTIADALRIVEAVDRESFGIWLDVWHVWQDPAVLERIRACGDRIFGVHVSDWHTPRHVEDRAIVGTGEIPLAQLLRAFADAGYSGAYILEIFSTKQLPDSLWAGDLDELIRASRAGLEVAWHQAMGA